MNRNTIIAILTLGIAIAGGYFLMGKQEGVSIVNEPQLYDVAVNETIEFISILDKIHPADIKLVSAVESEWPDRCLGLSQIGEMCTQVIVEGWKITLDAGGELRILRTDKEGNLIRRDMRAERE